MDTSIIVALVAGVFSVLVTIIQKARKLKRYWKTKGKAKLRRTLLKRKMSIRRRTSMGIK